MVYCNLYSLMFHLYKGLIKHCYLLENITFTQLVTPQFTYSDVSQPRGKRHIENTIFATASIG
uniref:Uncharacterized protein n=1 Tax=Octopus bimaculoides TaxID=37653 RepID=A0A0L8FI95_OCTBM